MPPHVHRTDDAEVHAGELIVEAATLLHYAAHVLGRHPLEHDLRLTADRLNHAGEGLRRPR